MHDRQALCQIGHIPSPRFQVSRATDSSWQASRWNKILSCFKSSEPQRARVPHTFNHGAYLISWVALSPEFVLLTVVRTLRLKRDEACGSTLE